LDAHYELNPNPDFIFYNGDSVPHWLQYWSVEMYTEDMVKTGITTGFNMIRARFPGVPIYPALGNHDMYLSDQLPPPPKSNAWLTWIAELWAPFLSDESIQTVSYGGYYTELIAPGHRLIHFNSIHCDSSNLYAALNQTDHADQFIWFNTTLSKARSVGEKVWITAHITPTDYLDFCRDFYISMATEYSDIITVHYFGDRHTDEFRIIRDPKNFDNAVGMMYVTPSVVPEIDQNPSFREYSYDPKTTQLLDYTHYHTILGDGTQSKLVWQLEYSAKSAYNLTDMSPNSWLSAWKRMNTTGSVLWSNFVNHYDAGYPKTCEDQCKQRLLNIIGMVPSTEFQWARASRLIGPSPDILKFYSLSPKIFAKEYSKWRSNSLTSSHPKEVLTTACDVCLNAMNIIDELLNLNTPDQVILEALTDICPYQTNWLPRTCVGFIWLYGPYALPVIAQEENPTKVCTALKICT